MDQPGPSNIFRSLMGEITQEQWETYQEMKRGQFNLVLSETESESSDNEINDTSCNQNDTDLMDIDESNMKGENISGMNETEKNDADSDDCDEADGQSVIVAPELTVKYINGEMSFSEFNDILEKTKEQESFDEGEKKSLDKRIADDAAKKAEEFELELTMKSKRRKGKLPKSLQGLMGAANLAFARGEHEDAIKMCMEIIRSAPSAPEPFQTLGMIYEEMGDMEKSFQFSLIGAYLNPNDADEWIKLAEISLEHGNTKQAISYYSNAIRCTPESIDLLWERCKLYEQEGEKKKALNGYEAILKQLKSEQGPQYVQLSRETAKQYHELNDDLAAIQVMEKAFEKFPSLITSEDVNLLLELQIGQKKYKDAICILQNHCGVSLIAKNREKEVFIESGFENVERCHVPDVLPIDLQIKLVVCLIHLKGLHLVQGLLEPLEQESVEEVGDLYLDVAEAYMQVKEFTYAIPILAGLVKSENYNMAAVWLRYGECYHATNNIEKATKIYKRVVEMAPCHSGARFSLSNLLQKSGKTREAITALKQSYEEGQKDAVIDVQLLMERCNLLYSQELWDEFIECSTLTLSSHFLPLVTNADFSVIIVSQTFRKRLESLKELQLEGNSKYPPTPKFTESKIPPEDMWELYLKVWRVLYDLGHFKKLQVLAMRATTSAIFNKMKKAKDTDFLAFLACYYNKNHNYAYCFIKSFVVKNINNMKLWNLFSQIVSMGQDIRHTRFCIRQMYKYPEHLPLQFLNGHTAIVAGTYKHALGEYIPILKKTPEDPFAVLCVGLTFIHLASQKFAEKRHSLVVQSCAFLMRYYELRGECQESLYNLGRAMHQLGLTATALHFYKKAILCPIPITDGEEDVFDLSHEIAYNISLIYQASRSHNLANMYLQKYCVI